MSEVLNWFREHSKQIIFWASIILIFGLVVSVSVLFGLYSNISDLNKSVKENEQKMATLENAQATDNDRGPRGPPGQRGPPGPQGSSGSPYKAMGPLRNLQSSGAYVMDRLHGSGTASISFLNQLSYQPNQIWVYQGNNLIGNQYGECLQGDQTSGNVFMAGCDPNNANQQWKHNNYGQISSVGSNNTDCLDVSLQSQFDGANKIEQGSKLQPGNSHYNLRRVMLKQCAPPNNLSSSQQWVFA